MQCPSDAVPLAMSDRPGIELDDHPTGRGEHAEADDWVAAAIAAEQATGEREETVGQARKRVAARLIRIGAGGTVLSLGAAMLVLPGPGWLMIAIGLGILARDVAWAERALERVRHRLPTDHDGRISRASIATAVVLILASAAVTVWWTTR